MTLALPGLVASSILAMRAWGGWRNALSAEASVRAVSALMHSSTQVMLTRGVVQEALSVSEPHYEPLAQAAARSRAAMQGAREALRKASLPADAIDQAEEGFATVERRALDAMSHRASVRSPRQAINRVIENLDEAALRVQRWITLANPSVGQIIELAHAAHDLRAIAGQRGTLLATWLSGHDLASGEKEEILMLTGRFAGAWDRVEQGLRAFPPARAVNDAMVTTRNEFFNQREPWYREMTKAAAAGAERPMSYKQYRQWTVAALTSLVPLRDALLAQAEAQAHLAVAKAQGDFLIATGAAAISFGLIAVAMLVLLRSLILPVRRMTQTMTGLAANDLSATLPVQSRLREIRAMADAVAVFRDNLINLHQREAELARTNRRFDAALANMSQGLCMFDRKGRLTVANRQMAAILGLPDAAVADGASRGVRFGELLDQAAGSGALRPVDAAWLVKQCTALAEASSPATFVWELTDGRALSVQYRPMADGSALATIEDVTERRQAEARIAHMAHHDTLTGLPNRVLFRERLVEALLRARRGESFAVLCLDLDHFKAVNDTLGHPIGDALLRAVTERLRLTLRETDTVARLGGDVFAILQASVNQPHDATALAQRLVETLAAPYQVDDHQVIIGASVGIALAPGDAEDPDVLMKNADLALYRAKADGRAAWRFFEPEMDARMQARRMLELDLRSAVAAEEFELHYQPLVDPHTRRPTGFEALLRWRHPSQGLVLPGEFVPLAEEIGLIGRIGEWVLRRACADAAAWPGNEKVAVNLSATQFRAGAVLAETVAEALAASGLPPARLELEVTEGVMLQDTEDTLATLHRIRALGVSISMDDFGTGYSSLSYLRRFPFNKVKIDQSFIRGLSEGGEDCAAIVRAVVGLCGSLGMATTAEGVETEEQIGRLAAEGCTELQGYLFSRPVPADQVPRLLGRPLDGTARTGQPSMAV